MPGPRAREPTTPEPGWRKAGPKGGDGAPDFSGSRKGSGGERRQAGQRRRKRVRRRRSSGDGG